jgi:capsid portal protein|tara:strand:- start:738 stop:2030 length:1293 start_codon:yes stop_codon:yes gene_type:complete
MQHQKRKKSKQKESLRTIQQSENTFKTKYAFVNLSTPEVTTEVKDLKKVRENFVPFGKDNLFPQYLSELKRQSSTHRSVLAQKTTFTTGGGFLTSDEKLSDFIQDVNANGESLKDCFKKLADDYYTYGNAYLEGVVYDGGVNFYHKDAATARMSKDKKSVLFNSDWTNYTRNKDKTQTISVYPNVSNGRFVIHYKDYESTFNFYGLPDYVAALEHIAIDYEIGKFNHTSFKNGFSPSAIVTVNGDFGESEAEKFVETAKETLTGSGNNSKILFLVKNGEDSRGTDVQIISNKEDGDFLDLQKLTDQNIITAHRWQPALSGIISSGKMNNTGSEIRIAYDLAMSTVIRDTTNILLEPIKKVINEQMGINTEDLTVAYEPPISFLSDIDPKLVLTINEQRAMLNKDLPEIKDGDLLISDRQTIKVERQNTEV